MIENSVKLTIIIPAYNVSEYIEECLQSVHFPLSKNIEVIVVDDASTDDTREKIGRFRDQDSRFQLLALDINIGLGNVRNLALQQAKGDYVVFLDGDDYIMQENLLIFLDKAYGDDADIVIGFDEYHVDRLNREPAIYASEMASWFDITKCTSVWDFPAIANHPRCCALIYRRTFLAKNGIVFHRKFREDDDFVLECLLAAERVSIYPHIHWSRYRQRDNAGNPSIMQQRANEQSIDLLIDKVSRQSRLLADALKAEGCPEQFILRKRRHVTHHIIQDLMPYLCDPKQESSERLVKACDILAELNEPSLDPEPTQRNRFQLSPRNRAVVEAAKAGRSSLVCDILAGQVAIDICYQIASTRDYPQLADSLVELVKAKPGIVASNAAIMPAIAPTSVERIHIHIGMMKTGSTALQNYLESNRASLLEYGVLYPETGIYRESGERRFRTSGHNFIYRDIRDKTSGYLTALYREVASHKGVRELIISSENMFGNLDRDAIRRLRQLTGQAEVFIHAYFRPQLSWIRSMHGESVTGGHDRTTSTLGEYARDLFNSGRLDYSCVIDCWASVFGKENVKVYPFEPANWDNGIASHFITQLSLPYIDGDEAPETEINASFGNPVLIEAVRQFNQYPFTDRKAYQKFIDGLMKDWSGRDPSVAAEGNGLSETLVQEITAGVADSNRRLISNYTSHVPTDFFVDRQSGTNNSGWSDTDSSMLLAFTDIAIRNLRQTSNAREAVSSQTQNTAELAATRSTSRPLVQYLSPDLPKKIVFPASANTESDATAYELDQFADHFLKERKQRKRQSLDTLIKGKVVFAGTRHETLFHIGSMSEHEGAGIVIRRHQFTGRLQVRLYKTYEPDTEDAILTASVPAGDLLSFRIHISAKKMDLVIGESRLRRRHGICLADFLPDTRCLIGCNIFDNTDFYEGGKESYLHFLRFARRGGINLVRSR